MKLIFNIKRKEFRGWSGEQLSIVRLKDGGFDINICGPYGSTGVLLDEGEGLVVADAILGICAIPSCGHHDDKNNASLKIGNTSGETLSVQYTNDGEPYREGVRIALAVEEKWDLSESIDFDHYEARNIAQYLKDKDQ
jgi:hypothetical protein